jgi:hypothetical protein
MNHTTILSVARETDRYIEITGAQLPTGRFNLRYDLIDMAKLTSERSKSTAVTSNAGSSVHLGRRNDIAFDEAIVAAEQLAEPMRRTASSIAARNFGTLPRLASGSSKGPRPCAERARVNPPRGTATG